MGTEHFNGSETIRVIIDDLGNKDGVAQTLERTIDITVTPINDEPINTLPVAQNTNEDTPLVLSQANSNQISVADPDSGDNSQNLTITLTVPDFDNDSVIDGTLTFSTTNGLTFDTSVGGGDGTIPASLFTFTGSITNLNTALNGITFNPASDFNGTTKINIISTDGTLSDTDDLAITVTAVNDAPTWTVPNPQTVNEDETLTFTTRTNVAQIDRVGITDGADGDIFTLTINGNTLDVTFAGDTAQTATSLATAVNGSSTLNVIVTAADQGGGVVNLTADSAGTPFTASIVTKTNNSGNASATLDNTTVNVTDSTIAITDDSSEDSSQVQLSISANLGLLILSSDNGLVFDEALGGTQAASTSTGASGYVITGTVSNINTALQGLNYTPLADKNGNDTLSLSVDDQGNHGTGNNSVVASSIGITINPVNDGPSVTAPVAVQQINEDEPLTFVSANGNAISVSDPDAAEINDELEVTLSALYGTLTLSTISNLTFTEGSGPTGSMMKFKGSEANLNTALTGLIYTPGSDHNDNSGSEVLTIQVSDQGYNGAEVLTATATISVQVTAINDTPVISFANSNPATNEDTALVISSANSNAITITDDATESNKSIQVTLSAANGTLTLASTDGLSFNGVNGTSSFIMAGTSDKIATAIEGLQYLPSSGSNGFGFNGNDTITVLVQDLGGTGSGGFLQASNSFTVTVNSLNDAPVHLFNGSNIPTAQTTKEDTSLTFNSANSNSITVTDDSDEGDTTVQTTLSVDSGNLTLSTISNLTFVTGDGDADSSMEFSGKLADINNALEGLVFTPAVDSSAMVSLTIVTDDQGNTGTGGSLSDTDTVTINVSAVNDAPTLNFANNSLTTSEDVALLLNAETNTLITLIDDASEDSSQVSLQLSVTSGILTLALDSDALTTNNIGIISGANQSSSMTLTGAVDKLNLALDGMQYTAPKDFVGTTTLTVIADDLGNYGEGDALQVTGTATITVSAVNDAPLLELPGNSFVNEDASLTFSAATNNALVVSDPDTYSDSSAIQASISLVDDANAAVSDRGAFSLGSIADLTFTVWRWR